MKEKKYEKNIDINKKIRKNYSNELTNKMYPLYIIDQIVYIDEVRFQKYREYLLCQLVS